MMRQEMQKALRALKTAKVDLDAGDGSASVNRSYYAMFYAARAALQDKGVDIPKTHSALIGQFSSYFVKTGVLARQLGRDFNKIEEQRRYVDYIADEEVPLDIANEILVKATSFVSVVATEIGFDTELLSALKNNVY